MKLLLFALTVTAGAWRKLVPSPGSLYSASSHFADLTRDLRAHEVGDLVTVLVSDTASAVSTGVTNTTRKSSAAAVGYRNRGDYQSPFVQSPQSDQ